MDRGCSATPDADRIRWGWTSLDLKGGTMPAAGLRKMVQPISGDPSPYGLLGGCTEIVTATDPHELNGTDTLSLSCADSNLWQDCPAPEFPNPAAKLFDRPRTCTYEPITVYAGVTCSTFGLSYEEGQERALEQLRLGEQRALEEFYLTRVLCGYATGNDLTPVAGALSIAAGVGVLEGWLAANYGGQGVLHVPAGAAALLSSHRVANWPAAGASPYTLAGNCVVIGAGYAANVGPADPGPGCTVAPSGESWLYITPPVRVRRDTPFLAVTNEGSSINTSTNDRYALAETTFVPETACCIAAAVRVVIC